MNQRRWQGLKWRSLLAPAAPAPRARLQDWATRTGVAKKVDDFEAKGRRDQAMANPCKNKIYNVPMDGVLGKGGTS